MEKLQLHYSKYCGLARQAEFRAWLKNVSPDLDEYLGQTSPVGGCKARAERMVHVYNRLYETGKGSEFEEVIRARFPYVIDTSAKPSLDLRKTVAPKAGPPITPIKASRVENVGVLNKHGVFRIYKPEILSFPQKKIIVNSDGAQLQAQLDYFVKDKYGVDSIIIEDHAYIEFFEHRYKDVAEKMPKEKRDIFIYRQRNKNANSISS